MRWLMVPVLLVGLTLLSDCGALLGPHAGSFSRAPHWERIWVKDPGAGGYGGQWSDIDFIDARQGWMGHSAQPLLRTSDGGSTWTEQYAPSPQIFLGCLDFVNERVGWTVESGWPSRMVSVTADGGVSWQRSPLKREHDLQELAAVSATEAWAIGPLAARNHLFHTVDAGVTWSDVSYPIREPGVQLDAIGFVDATHGWIVAVKRGERDLPSATRRRPISVLRTIDGGKSFEVSTIAPGGAADICRLEFRNRREGWVALGSASLLHTEDGGKTWNRVAPPPSVVGRKRGASAEVHLRDCSFPTPTSGWAVGDVGYVEALALHTEDGGKTWRRERTGTETLRQSRLERVVFADEKHGWAYGAGGDPGDHMIGRGNHWMTFMLRYVP